MRCQIRWNSKVKVMGKGQGSPRIMTPIWGLSKIAQEMLDSLLR